MAPPRGGTQPCEPRLVCEERRDYAHATIRWGKGGLSNDISD